jgi:hypothetical protein
MRMSDDTYNDYKKKVQDIYYHGSKEDMERLYNEIISQYGLCEELYDLDHYQGSWTILPKR